MCARFRGSPAAFVTAVAVIALLILDSPSDACFIRNCPKGGKRSMKLPGAPVRQCTKCGLGGLGQCVGPNICCEPNSGCQINTEETEVCQQENKSTTPCFVSGEICGSRDSGNCVANGICCDSESCFMNDVCRRQDHEDSGKDIRNGVLQLIQLLKGRDYI